MARQRGIIKLAGTIAGLTFVESQKYEKHVRKARGTVKKPKVNSSLRTNAKNAKPVTDFAKGILKELRLADRGFSSSSLWSEMIGRMFQTKAVAPDKLLESLKEMELNERYPFEKVFSPSPELTFSVGTKNLSIDLAISSNPVFPELETREYLFEVIVLFLNKKGNYLSQRKDTGWLCYMNEPRVFKLKFTKPKGFGFFLVVEGVKGGNNHEAIESFAARGYKVNGWGKC